LSLCSTLQSMFGLLYPSLPNRFTSFDILPKFLHTSNLSVVPSPNTCIMIFVISGSVILVSFVPNIELSSSSPSPIAVSFGEVAFILEISCSALILSCHSACRGFFHRSICSVESSFSSGSSFFGSGSSFGQRGFFSSCSFSG
jgi:hypothetical protein